MAETTASPAEEPDDLGKLHGMVTDLRQRLEAIEAILRDLPKPEDYGRELPVVRFSTDKYFKYTRDGVNLVLQLNVDQLKRDNPGMGGGGGVLFAGYCQVEAVEATGVIDARGNPVQWLYTIRQVQKGGAAYGNAAWDDTVEGYAGDARNMCEVGNTGIGVQDNGVDFDAADFPEGFEMIPVRGTVPFFIMADSNGNIEAWLDRCNAVDGPCSGSYA